MTLNEAVEYLNSLSTELVAETLVLKMQKELHTKSGGNMKFGHFRIYIHEGDFAKVEAWPRDILIKGDGVRRRTQVSTREEL